MLSAIRTLIITLIFAIFIRIFIAENYIIPSQSMLPILEEGDVVLVTKFDYGLGNHSSLFPLSMEKRLWSREPSYGDVVVFHCGLPNADICIKRMIGLPGDVIKVDDDRININGELVTRLYEETEVKGCSNCEVFYQYVKYKEILPNGSTYHSIYIRDAYHRYKYDFNPYSRLNKDFKLYIIPKDRYFLMGDNRDNSNDSRAQVGMVKGVNLIGKGRYVIWNTEKVWKMIKTLKWDKSIFKKL